MLQRPISTTTRRAEMRDCLQTRRIAAVLLCQSLPLEEREWAIALTQKVNPATRILVMDRGASELQQAHPNLELFSGDGPGALINAVRLLCEAFEQSQHP